MTNRNSTAASCAFLLREQAARQSDRAGDASGIESAIYHLAEVVSLVGAALVEALATGGAS